MARVTIAELAESRARAYRFLSDLFIASDATALAELIAAVPLVRQRSQALAQLTSSRAWNALLDDLATLNKDSAAAMGDEYGLLFLAGAGSASCPPFESAYARRGGMDTGWLTARLERAYSVAGLAAGGGEALDHVSVELDFMAVLIGEEQHSWQENNRGDAARWLRSQRSFLESHLLQWLPPFAARLSRIASSSVYSSVAGHATAFAAHDHALVTAMVGWAKDMETTSS